MACGTLNLITSCLTLADQVRGRRDGSDLLDPLQLWSRCTSTSWTTWHCRQHQRLVRSVCPKFAFAFPGELSYAMLPWCLTILRALRSVYPVVFTGVLTGTLFQGWMPLTLSLELFNPGLHLTSIARVFPFSSFGNWLRLFQEQNI